MTSRLWHARESAVDRFLRYVRVDTQSAEDQPTVPSTAKQWDLARILAAELEALGVPHVRLSEHCTVYARIPASVPDASGIPTIGFVSHVDTSSAVSGTDVQPIVHRNYQGGDIVLPGDPTEVIRVADHPALRSMIGDDIITSDGTTLLGSDDKSGVAAIMTMADILMGHPELPHGEVAIAFTADEEIGLGVEHFDVAGFGARYAYTVDGGAIGEINSETWSARMASVTFTGKNTHPGTAKNLMVNAIYALATFVAGLPAGMRPETTEGREGFLHPYQGTLDVSAATLKVLLRDFDLSGLEAQERILRDLAAATETAHPGVHVAIEIKDSYRNMHEIVRHHPALIENAFEATRRAGFEPYLEPIRGGTDGSKLTFKGLPCPNLFTGGHNFHSKQEFNSRRGLEATTALLVQLVQVFAERA